ncbi:Peptidase A1 domain-containing protein [Aphelenchoides fujianensis]|nr:Peptidase A1 domain-containing protein [Aphelenchoides fujianensis]
MKAFACVVLLFLVFEVADCRSFAMPVQRIIRPTIHNTTRLTALMDVYGQALSNTANVQYRGKISIGTPGQSFNVVFGADAPQLSLPESVVFGAASELTFSDEGILGLGSTVNPLEFGSSIVHEAYRQGVLDAPLFSVWMQKCEEECEDGGVIQFGSEDRVHCQRVRPRDWVPVDEGVAYWQFTLQGGRMGGSRVQLPAKAIADSGTSLLVFPLLIADEFARGVGARKVAAFYFLPCSSRFSFDFEVNGRRYSIPARHLLLEVGNGECQLAMQAGSFGVWILGTPFFRSHCQVHDFARRRVAFARVKRAFRG